MKQADLDTISEIVARYGFIEWSLVGFTPTGNYQIFSYFTDPSVMPIFKIVLISMLKTVEEYLEKNHISYEKTIYHVGKC